MIRRLLIALTTALMLTACGDPSWQTKDISGLMPELKFTLTGENGEPVTAERFDGHVTVLFFGYSFCPDVCPATLARLSAVIDRLPDSAAKNVRVLFVSVDPDRDTPERLRTYTEHFGERFFGATGSQDQLKDLNRRYRVTYGYGEKKGSGEGYLVSHASAIFVFDEAGEPRLLMRSSDGLEAMAADLERLAG